MRANKFLLLICLLTFSCAPKKEIVYNDKHYFHNQVKRDSLIWIIRDSVHIQTKNDTVFVDRWKTIYKDKIINTTDTIIIRDSIQIQTLKNSTNKIDKFYKNLGKNSILFIIFVLLFAVIKAKFK